MVCRLASSCGRGLTCTTTVSQCRWCLVCLSQWCLNEINRRPALTCRLMLLWQPATVFCVVYYYLSHCLTWQINSLSLNIAGPRRGPKGRSSKPEELSRGWGSWRTAPSPAARGSASAVSSPSVVRGEAPSAKSFGAFWILRQSCY